MENEVPSSPLCPSTSFNFVLQSTDLPFLQHPARPIANDMSTHITRRFFIVFT
jgi:hypothetical protein